MHALFFSATCESQKWLGESAKGGLSSGSKSLPRVFCTIRNPFCTSATPFCTGATPFARPGLKRPYAPSPDHFWEFTIFGLSPRTFGLQPKGYQNGLFFEMASSLNFFDFPTGTSCIKLPQKHTYTYTCELFWNEFPGVIVHLQVLYLILGTLCQLHLHFPEGPPRQIDVSQQKLSPHCLAAIFNSQLPSPKLSPKMPPKLSLPHKRGLFILFQN